MATSRKALARATNEENAVVKKHTTIKQSASNFSADSQTYCLTLVPRDFVQNSGAAPYQIFQNSPHCFKGRGYILRRLQLEALLGLPEASDTVLCRCIIIRFDEGLGGNAPALDYILDAERTATGSQIGPLCGYKKYYQNNYDTGDNYMLAAMKFGKHKVLYDRKILLNNDHEQFLINLDYRPSKKYGKVLFNNTTGLGAGGDTAVSNEPTTHGNLASQINEDMQGAYVTTGYNITNPHNQDYYPASSEATAEGHIWMFLLLEPGSIAAENIPSIKYRWTKWFYDA